MTGPVRPRDWRYGLLGGLLLLAVPAFGFDCTVRPQGQELAQFSAMLSEAEIGQWAAAALRREYRVLSEGTVVQRVQAIAERVRAVVRQRPDRRYMVTVLDTKQPGACAYPGGYVFLTRGIIEQAKDDDGLALVVAHEFAHIATGHMDTPLAHELPARLEQRLRELGAVGRGFTTELRQRLCQSVTADEMRKLHELQADQQAIVYVALAGYNPLAAVHMLDAVGAMAASSCQPAAAERKARIAAQMQGVLEQLEKFQAGVRFYLHQEYERAAELFAAFLSVYPGREVHHNLAVAYHRLALHHQDPTRQLTAECSLALESETQARRFQVRLPGGQAGHERFQSYLTEAIKQYLQALEQDPAYAPAAANLACAYLEQGKYARAQGELEDALRANPTYAVLANNLGVTFWLQGLPAKAIEYLEQAVRLEPRYAEPYCNLALLHESQAAPAVARTAWQHYHRLRGAGTQRCARLARQRLGLPEATEATTSRQAEAERAVLPLAPGQPLGARLAPEHTVTLLPLCAAREAPACPQLQVLGYEQGAMTVQVEDHTITQVVLSHPTRRATAQGIRLAQTEDDVWQRYGAPARVEETATGRYLLYDRLHLAFAVRAGQVVSWVVFQ